MEKKRSKKGNLKEKEINKIIRNEKKLVNA